MQVLVLPVRFVNGLVHIRVRQLAGIPALELLERV